ncbi:hypothetical protein [Mucilaginibacter terrae]|uniref:VCBS repeat-containing protein n=1 Tax=Mucilaginibacter terrae TaxID=1955052 RepID=A0ABU3H1G1_9SPHI|nr:hypothetical protein [Mucilaginibacter terrae]MDT3405546.1 hypothetical protein [Mucilaginibacter terrae]
MKYIIGTFLLIYSLSCFAQYPFEKHPPIKYQTAKFNKIPGRKNNDNIWTAKYQNYRVELLEIRLEDSTNVVLYFKNKAILKLKEGVDINDIALYDTQLYIANIDNNGFPDFKIIIYNNGSGLAGSLEHKIFLFNHGKNRFQNISFMDFFANTERDFNGDGKFEIIGQSYLSYQNHAYWVFDLYNYKKGKLVNVGKRFNYPILTRFLASKESYSITHNMSRKQMKQFSHAFPRDYKQGKLLVK